jgi:hypothetical protein
VSDGAALHPGAFVEVDVTSATAAAVKGSATRLSSISQYFIDSQWQQQSGVLNR